MTRILQLISRAKVSFGSSWDPLGRGRLTLYFRSTPKAGIGNLLDDLVGDGEQLKWHGKAEHPGGLGIDD